MWTKKETDAAELCRLADTMLGMISHRGPDDGGYAVGPRVFLGNRRLKILDLTDAGNQPFFSDDGKIWLVFNGEIYNYRELRKELEGEFHFHSETDTEVLLRAYEKWGIGCVDRFIGMFAFAIWDSRNSQLIICRDRLGIKPLYYWNDGKKVLFASEIKAILAAGIAAVPNQKVLHDYLVRGFYDHTAETFFSGIHQLSAGHFMVIDDHGINVQRYWDPLKASSRLGLSADGAIDAYMKTLESSVHLRMRADVPRAVMLSGGLDSSVLADIAEQDVEDEKLDVITIRFNDSRYDEGRWAELTAKDRGWNMHSVTVTESEVENGLVSTLWHQDEPYAGVMTFGDDLVAKLARELGIYVLLEGQGSDETLGGYEYYYKHYLADLTVSHKDEAEILYQKYCNIRGIECKDAGKDVQEFIADVVADDSKVAQDGTMATREQVLTKDFLSGTKDDYAATNVSSSKFDNALYRDLFLTKVPRVLRFKDRSHMMYGVELRVPFLDHRLVEIGLAIPANRKLVDGYTKWPLREKMLHRLDRETCLHVKRQVQNPQREWLAGPLSGLVDDIIHSSSFGRGIFDVKAVDSFYKDYKAFPEKRRNSFPIWQWLMIEWWFRLFIDKMAFTPKLFNGVVLANKRRYPPADGARSSTHKGNTYARC
jgi:asparagine synthase (glutamine-hydrolysing)